MERIPQELEDRFVALLERELVPALGCTEPIALAYASARAREVLGVLPERFSVAVCGNILKNVKSVIVPNTNGLKGVRAAVLIGAIGGNAAKRMEVLEDVTPEHIALCTALMQRPEICAVSLLESEAKLHFTVEAFAGDDRALVEIMHAHTNIVRIERNGRVLLQCPCEERSDADSRGYAAGMTLESIYAFADTVPLCRIRDMLARQISCNLAIASVGLRSDYGLCVGQTLLQSRGNAPEVRARALAAAASDARMSGCTLPVVINAGSGNQGATVSLPVIAFAEALGSGEEKLLRALALSNLVSLYQKASIGRLSAYCGAVSAACGSGAAIAYLHDLPFSGVLATVENTLANVAGIVCDGAKPSCAAKIASAVDAAVLGFELARAGRTVAGGEGLVAGTVDQTISNYGVLAHDGMCETDRTILRLMTDEPADGAAAEAE